MKKRNYIDIKGWFNYEFLYKMVVERASSDNFSHFVEIGSFFGKSSLFMADCIYSSKKDIRFDMVDNFCSFLSKDVEDYYFSDDLFKTKSKYYSYHIFCQNMFWYADKIKLFPLRMESADASVLYDENSLDFCFLDADHTYKGIRSDLNCWYSKVKTGGIIAGHDYDNRFCGGLKNGVDEFFNRKNKKVNIFDKEGEPFSWYVIKE